MGRGHEYVKFKSYQVTSYLIVELFELTTAQQLNETSFNSLPSLVREVRISSTIPVLEHSSIRRYKDFFFNLPTIPPSSKVIKSPSTIASWGDDYKGIGTLYSKVFSFVRLLKISRTEKNWMGEVRRAQDCTMSSTSLRSTLLGLKGLEKWILRTLWFFLALQTSLDLGMKQCQRWKERTRSWVAVEVHPAVLPELIG